MTDNIKCPNCHHVAEKVFEDDQINLRSLLAWDAFCKIHFEVFPDLESISVNDNIITGNITFNYKTHSVDLFGALPYTMGWQHMPERRRDDE